MPFKHLLSPGHSACAGCGELLAMRHILEAAGPNTIIAGATGCSEVTTTRYPQSAFGVPWIHANFENAIAVASGIGVALRNRSISPFRGLGGISEPNLLAWGGDGAAFDIGIGLMSGSWERRENILFVCLDNEAYMNTGVQSSGATPFDANTTTTPPGEQSSGNNLRKKDMVRIALAHDCVYVATATVGNLIDLQNKIKKACSMKGPKYIQVLVTCVPGWYTEPEDTLKVARLAEQTGIYPVLEYINGELSGVAKCPRPRPKVEEYLKLQGRYKHLFGNGGDKVALAEIQRVADENVERYQL